MIIKKISFLILFLSLFIIIYSTLSPFNFSLKESIFTYNSSNYHFFAGKYSGDIIDLIRNIILFIPFGFSINYCQSKQTRQYIQRIIIIICISCVVSFSVESLQIFLNRDPALIDILSNVLGGIIGASIFHLTGPKLIHYIYCNLLKSINLRVIRIAFISYTIFAIFVLIPTQSTSFRNWNPNYKLLVGNEGTKDRAWEGWVSLIQISDIAFSQSRINSLFQASEGSAKNQLCADYHLDIHSDQYQDKSGNLGPLIRVGDIKNSGKLKGAIITKNTSLEAKKDINLLVNKLKRSNQFTLNLILGTNNIYQSGPARIVSLSKDTSRRNFTLAQVENDLQFRIRTPLTGVNGVRPFFTISNVFHENDEHHLVITYTGSKLKIFIDSVDNLFSFKLLPGMNTIDDFMHPYRPFTLATTYSDGLGTIISCILYRIIVFSPIISLLYLMLPVYNQKFFMPILIETAFLCFVFSSLFEFVLMIDNR